jgi:uncharacterized membrane protein YcaP (DUF421 family)
MDTVIRVVVIYLFIVFALRIMGKREFSQLSPLELVTLLIIPEVVSQSLVREDFSLTNALIGVATLLSLTFVASVLQYRHKRVEEAMFGTPSVLVQHGRFVEESLHKEHIPPAEVFAAMHESGLEKLSQVKWAVLEQDGRISIVPVDDRDQDKQGQPEEKQVL